MSESIEFLVGALRAATIEIATQTKLVETLVNDVKFVQQQREAALADRDTFREQRDELRTERAKWENERNELNAKLVSATAQVTEAQKRTKLFQLLGEPGERTFYKKGIILYSVLSKDPEGDVFLTNGTTLEWSPSGYKTLAAMRVENSESTRGIVLVSYESAMIHLRDWLAKVGDS